MTDEEKIQREVDKRIASHNRDREEIESISKRIFAPMDKFLDEWQEADLPNAVTRIDGKVDLLAAEQKTQGREIGELKGKMDTFSSSLTTVRTEVAAMPGNWREDITRNMREHRKECLEGSGVVDLAEERGRATAERLIPNRRWTDTRGTLLRTLAIKAIPYILFVGVALGAYLVSGGDTEATTRALRAVSDAVAKVDSKIGQVEKKVEAVEANENEIETGSAQNVLAEPGMLPMSSFGE
jgi:outer membrane murein-binding lipoprotein Lpp